MPEVANPRVGEKDLQPPIGVLEDRRKEKDVGSRKQAGLEVERVERLYDV